METKAIYHHLTPQTYMRAWKNGNSHVYVVEKGTDGVGDRKSTKKFGGVDNYHSLRVGFPYHTKDDTEKFFYPLEKYTVMKDDEVIKSTIEMNKQFYDFDSWTIIHNDSKRVVDPHEKKTLKDAILKIHVRDIEVGWSRLYENYWNSINETISNKVLANVSSQAIQAVKRDELIKFMVSLEWRTKPYHPSLQEAFDTVLNKEFFGIDWKGIIIPEEERLYPFLENMYDEFAHSFVIKLYRQFLDEKGTMMDEAIKIINNFCIVLFLAPNDGEFITSDNPVCRFTNNGGATEYIFPINPKIACGVFRNGAIDKYMIKKLTKDELIHYNNKLKENCNKGYIMREQNRTLYFG
ncbi:DUF4238 domain-containing protein [Peribacillus sp. YIM B13477]|uniref:DUF4238 domain-containing protein n=1 Tax=Peribacillus sp. YIM B13477 TaxID=3366300 RepID=UPI00366F8B74